MKITNPENGEVTEIAMTEVEYENWKILQDKISEQLFGQQYNLALTALIAVLGHTIFEHGSDDKKQEFMAVAKTFFLMAKEMQ